MNNVVKNALAGLTFDQVQKLSDQEVAERFLVCWQCPNCASKRLKVNDATGHKEENSGYNKLTFRVGCYNCRKGFVVTLMVPTRKECFDEIYMSGKALELAKEGKRSNYKPPRPKHQITGQEVGRIIVPPGVN